MKSFVKFYKWGMNVKFHMALYTVAILCFAGIAALVWGDGAVSVWHMLQMLLLSFAMGIVEYALFPVERVLEGDALVKATILWAACANVLFVGGALVFGWFAIAPVWYSVLMLVLLELSLVAMWFGLHIALRADTAQLNSGLRLYQKQ